MKKPMRHHARSDSGSETTPSTKAGTIPSTATGVRDHPGYHLGDHPGYHLGDHPGYHLVLAMTACVLGILLLSVLPASALENEDCLACHGEQDFAAERDGKEVPLHVNAEKLKASVHGGLSCAACHADVEELPHEPALKPVECGQCHSGEYEEYSKSLHGKAAARKVKYAPGCKDCHGYHDVMLQTHEESKSYRINIPGICGRCHHESSDVETLYNVDEKDALENYSMSMHGEGMFKRGLIVSAVCSDCHTSHSVLPHEDPASSINRKNIAGICRKCHGQIINVHKKVIYGKKWQEKPDEVPVCTDCHSTHEIRRVFHTPRFMDNDCLGCHGKKDIHRVRDGEELSLHVDREMLRESAHGKEPCIKCHTNVSTERDPVCLDSGKVDCSICHEDETADYKKSIHGRLHAQGDPVAPDCKDCHGTHLTMSKSVPASPTFVRNVPELCARCHREGSKAARRYNGAERHIISSYEMSIHGEGLVKSGLVVTAVCDDCHTAHMILPSKDPGSSVHQNNIAKTCAKCHEGIYSEFAKSVHNKKVGATAEKLPVCNDCHSAHEIKRAERDDFRKVIISQCGKCHEEVTKTYFETYHGKVSKLGGTKTARCSDCHGAHNILPVSDPESTLSRANIIDTCKKCHPNTTRKFTGYLTHATHHNRSKYPVLFFAFWAMTALLAGTFSFFGVHTILWLPRSFRQWKTRRMKKKEEKHEKMYIRLDPFHRTLHFIMIISFFGLTITGMTLKFSYMQWAAVLSRMMGGFEIAGFIHRFCAVLTFTYFGAHLIWVINDLVNDRRKLRERISAQDSILPLPRDVSQFVQTVKWFLGKGERPQYGRWTYWEKFDYFAVFWGVAIIGSTGLFLWFPNFFTKLLPGWVLNVATIIHSDEALLAVGFIFTIHFFNTHFRPEKFPMDPVIFTGRVSLEELQYERPLEYRELVESGKLKDIEERGKLPRWYEVGARIFGFSMLATGGVLIGLILYSIIEGYK